MGLFKEPTNADRAEWAFKAIQTFRYVTGADRDDVLADLLADLLHWADENGFDFDRELSRARGHYAEECAEEMEDAI